MIPNLFFQLDAATTKLFGIFSFLPEHQGELPGRCGGCLNFVQMFHILSQQLPQRRNLFLFQSCLVVGFVGLKGLSGVQRQHPHIVHAPQEIAQRPDAAMNSIPGQHREIVRGNQIKNQLSLSGLDAAFGEPVDAHELPCRLMLPQLLFDGLFQCIIPPEQKKRRLFVQSSPLSVLCILFSICARYFCPTRSVD